MMFSRLKCTLNIKPTLKQVDPQTLNAMYGSTFYRCKASCRFHHVYAFVVGRILFIIINLHFLLVEAVGVKLLSKWQCTVFDRQTFNVMIGIFYTCATSRVHFAYASWCQTFTLLLYYILIIKILEGCFCFLDIFTDKKLS